MSLKDIEDIDRRMQQLEAIERVKIALPHLRYAAKAARSYGTPKLAILAENETGSGKVCVSFDCEGFLKDIEFIIGAEPQTAADDTNPRAAVPGSSRHQARKLILLAQSIRNGLH